MSPHLPWALGLVLGCLAVAYMLVVSIVIAGDDLLSRRQRLAQWLVVWLLPVAGAAFVHAMRHALAARPRARERGFVPEQNEHAC